MNEKRIRFKREFEHNLVSRLDLAHFNHSCPNSPSIETGPCSLQPFLSRFLLYRDWTLLTSTISVPIPSLSRLDLAHFNHFCPNSPSIETGPCSMQPFLSRLLLYRDWTLLTSIITVPIPSLSRLNLLNATIPVPIPLLSRLNLLTATIPVPIPLLSRLELAHCSHFCPNSSSIETGPCSLQPFLSQFLLYRDWSLLNATIPVPIPPLSRLNLLNATIPVPIPLLSRLDLAHCTRSCPDSPFIETGSCS